MSTDSSYATCSHCGETIERSTAAWMSATRMFEKCPGHMVPITPTAEG